MSAPSSPVRVALLGAGRWGRNYVRTIAETPGMELAIVASRNPETSSLCPPGCAVLPEWREALDPRRVNGVIVATSPQLHAEMAIAALDARLPVLIEKPLTMDVEQARAIRRKAVDAGVPVMVDHTHLFHPAYRELKKLLSNYGAVREIKSEAGSQGPFRPDVPVLWDWGAHDVAMCMDVLSARPQHVKLRVVERRRTETGVEETVDLGLDFPGGASAAIRLSNASARIRTFTVRCERGSLTYDALGSEKLFSLGGDRLHRAAHPVSAELPLNVLVREFGSLIRAGTKDLASLDLGVKVVEVLAECERAA